MAGFRRWRGIALVVAIWLISAWYMLRPQSDFWRDPDDLRGYRASPPHVGKEQGLRWKKRPDHYPAETIAVLPTDKPAVDIPEIQAPRPKGTAAEDRVRLQRQAAVKESFQHSWNGYKEYAWLHDEVRPISTRPKDPFGGWAASLVDALDTLWIMDMKKDFEEAVKACEKIDFSVSEGQTINVFETTIRYLGGFLATYELSNREYPSLLKKAVEVGELLMCAFDTPNRMPITRWDWQEYTKGRPQTAPRQMLVSEIGSLGLEFTKLAQLTGNMKYYDAVQRIADEFEKAQKTTQLPGMWPVVIDASQPAFNGHGYFTLGGMSDSTYEYLPKQYMLLGGRLSQPRKMYEGFIDVAKTHLFFHALNPQNTPIIIPGDVDVAVDSDKTKITPSYRGQHLTCFTGGMVGIASRIFNRPNDLDVAAQITDGCVWAYNSTASGIGPEIFDFVPCGKGGVSADCTWNDDQWREAVEERWQSPGDSAHIIESNRLPTGMPFVKDKRYILRPEAIESVFIMYRLTGNPAWMDKAWGMWERIETLSRTKIAASAMDDVTQAHPRKTDSMESFWLAETLKYFYLIFSDWDLVSLDKWVLNTEAHPLRRMD